MSPEKQERPATTAGRSPEIPQGTRIGPYRTIPPAVREAIDEWRSTLADRDRVGLRSTTGDFPRWRHTRDRVHGTCTTNRNDNRRQLIEGYALPERTRLCTFPEAVTLGYLDIEPTFPIFDWELEAAS